MVSNAIQSCALSSKAPNTPSTKIASTGAVHRFPAVGVMCFLPSKSLNDNKFDGRMLVGSRSKQE